MSLITRCPACATTFKVVPDQLRISDGWVRCGQCTEVFDAPAHLVQEGDSPAGGQTGSPSPRLDPPAFLRAPVSPSLSPTLAPSFSPPATSASATPRTPVAGPVQASVAAALASSPVSAPITAPVTAPVPAMPPAPVPPPRPSREPVMPELVMPDLVLPPPPPPPPPVPVHLRPPEPPEPAAQPAARRSADELLAEQLSRLDLDLTKPDARRQIEPTLDEDDLGIDLSEVFASQAQRDEINEIDESDEVDEPHVPVEIAPVSEALEPRVRPLGDRFPVLSVPELDLPGTPRPPRTDPPGVTLAALRFPDDPAPAAAPRSEAPAPASKFEPLLHDPDAVEEVSPSLLSESVAMDASGDLSAQWAADAPEQAMKAAPIRRAEDEADAVGPDAMKGLQFLRRARREAFWRRPLVRGVLGLATLLLSALLVAQWALHERARLVAAEPGLRPALQALCDVVGCELAPLRRIESFVIESSTFNKTHGEGFQLALAIRNTGALPLGMPAAELSLTDSQDQAVLRRVFLPTELGAPPTLGPGADWTVTLPVRVAGAASLRIAGYRVLVFYP